MALMHSMVDGGLQSPILSGLLLGLLMIGPEHLGTLMALSTLTTGIDSFKVGVSWGLGHSVGMLVIVPPFLLIEKFTTQSLDVTVEQWEYWGDYLIGASLIIVAIYFYVYEDKYLQQQADGTYAARCCGCHDAGHDHDHDHDVQDKMEKTPLLQDTANASSRFSGSASVWVSWESSLLGMLQGLCCPMAMMGVGFIGKMSSSTLPNLLLFLVVFLLASAIGSGVLTSCWGLLSTHGLASCISPLVVFRVANFLTFALGVIWITANACGILHYINYMDHKMGGMSEMGGSGMSSSM